MSAWLQQQNGIFRAEKPPAPWYNNDVIAPVIQIALLLCAVCVLATLLCGGLPAEAREPESILAERVEATQFFFSDDTPAPGAMRSPGVFFQMLFQFFLM